MGREGGEERGQGMGVNEGEVGRCEGRAGDRR